jgi:hypothetical protein
MGHAVQHLKRCLSRAVRPFWLGGMLVLSLAAAGRADNFASITLSLTLFDPSTGPVPSTSTFVSLSNFGQTAEPFTSLRSFLAIPLNAAVTESTNTIIEATLYFRQPGGSYKTAAAPYNFSPTPQGQTYRGVGIIPEEFITEAGIQYYVEVRTDNNLIFNLGYATQPISVPFQAVYETSLDPDGNTIDLPDYFAGDGSAMVTFPAGAVNSPTTFKMSQLSQDQISTLPRGDGLATSERPVAAYELSLASGGILKPATLSLLYADVDGAPGQVDGTGASESDLRLFWWDGFAWRLIGGSVNPSLNAVSGFSSKLGTFALFPVSTFPTSKVFRPLERIITPNGDGINDSALFAGLATPYEIRIYDITGRRVRTINSGPSPEWDGKDDDGKTVEIGSYIYQYRNESFKDWISGTVAVAK